MNPIQQYYEKYDEDARLQTNPSKRIEWITTTNVLNEHLEHDSRILELGAGTGVYSFYFAENGHRVTATDLSPKHVIMMEQKLQQKPHLKMNIKEADATDLVGIGDKVYDAVLCLGPMYHLISIEQQTKCIAECLRVLKRGGLLAIAYIPRFTVWPYLVKGDRKFLTKEWVDRVVDKGYTSVEEEDCFWTNAYFHTPEEMERVIKPFGTEKIDHAATDGQAPILSDIVNELNEKEYDAWVYYHLKTCREPSVLGNSNHALYVCRKV